MSGFQGCGTGSVSYEILNQPVQNARECTVLAFEDDNSGTLTLDVSFTDPSYGEMQVGIGVFGYSSTTSVYQTVDQLHITVESQTPPGGWASAAASSVFLTVSQSSGTTKRTYSGTFNASNLNWNGPASQNSLAIKFASYSFPVTADSSL